MKLIDPNQPQTQHEQANEKSLTRIIITTLIRSPKTFKAIMEKINEKATPAKIQQIIDTLIEQKIIHTKTTQGKHTYTLTRGQK
jgi:DNA-binding HxlR family transcriptional regulator